MAGQLFHLPRTREPNYRFGFTAFADTMFQLLIFFILSSGLTPYSLLTLKTSSALTEGGTGAGGNQPAATPPAAVASADVALWTVESGGLLVGGQRFPFELLPDLAQALGSPAAPADVVLILRSGAKVQDMATVLAALQAANVGSVRIAAEGG